MPDPPSVPESVVADLQAGRRVEHHFEFLFRAYYRAVSGYFQRHGIDPDDSHDLAQEVFLVVLADIGSLRSAASFRSWLFGISRNKLWRHIETKKIRRQHESEQPPETSDESISTPSVRNALDETLDRERRLRLRQELEALPNQMRACVKLSVLDGLNYSEIANRLGVSENTVKVHIHRARHNLKSRLGSIFGIEPG